jgi:hypothetical protein
VSLTGGSLTQKKLSSRVAGAPDSRPWRRGRHGVADDSIELPDRCRFGGGGASTFSLPDPKTLPVEMLLGPSCEHCIAERISPPISYPVETIVTMSACSVGGRVYVGVTVPGCLRLGRFGKVARGRSTHLNYYPRRAAFPSPLAPRSPWLAAKLGVTGTH